MVGGGMGRRDSTHDGRPAIILPSLYLQEKLLPPSLFAGELLSPRINCDVSRVSRKRRVVLSPTALLHD